MFRTTKDKLVNHLRHDLNICEDSLVFLHSGILGLGILDDGIETITSAFASILSRGALVIPSFTYSWNTKVSYDPYTTECPEMGAYAKNAWKDSRFKRNLNPNFAIAVMDQTPKKIVEKSLLHKKTRLTCFGIGSVFDEMYKLSSFMPAKLVLLGGAHNDVVFRSTFIHYVEEKIGVPYRYTKFFPNPKNSKEKVSQLVRFQSKREFLETNQDLESHFTFPIKAKYNKLGEDLLLNKLLIQSTFGYSKTRSVSLPVFCDFIESRLRSDSEYLLK